MSSVLPGFEYDIFISYRQKDNKYDGWVTEFADHLQKELEATFKEDISVYFDINPHDGLLETHDVDESLKSKLKCLIFIPVISRTYCDPKSFAWGHEFKAFVELASRDQFGLKITLPKGNVANRVLPVRIHDLDDGDSKLCESILGGVLRPVDFIYKSAGVNRPLRAHEDHPQDNLNRTYYRDQINKVANAIKEVISGLQTGPAAPVKAKAGSGESSVESTNEEIRAMQAKPAKIIKRKPLYWAIGIGVLIVIAAIFAIPKIFPKNSLDSLRSLDGRISITIMPFRNMTNDTIWDVWQDGIKDNLTTYLSSFPEYLIVRPIESVDGLLRITGLTNYASITSSVAGEIAKKLDTKVYVSGSITHAPDRTRVNALLINSRTKEAIKAFQREGNYKEVFQIIDSLSVSIKDYLTISVMEKEILPDFRQLISTDYSEAYRYYMYGNQAFYQFEYTRAKDWYVKAIGIDSSFTEAIRMLTMTCFNLQLYDELKIWCLRLNEKRDLMSAQGKMWADIVYALCFKTIYDRIKYTKVLLDYDDQKPVPYSNLAEAYSIVHQYDKAISLFKKELELYKKWDSRPRWSISYAELGYSYHQTGQYRKEKMLYKKAEMDFPDNHEIIFRQAVLALYEGKINDSNEYIEKYRLIGKDNSWPEAEIITSLGKMYSEAGIQDKAEAYYRQALSLEPDQPGRMNTLAYFLIDKERNNSEGLEIINKLLESSPDNFDYLQTKGWGLFKQGKYEEAHELLQRSWDLRRKNAIYDHEAYLHLEEVKKAARK